MIYPQNAIPIIKAPTFIVISDPSFASAVLTFYVKQNTDNGIGHRNCQHSRGQHKGYDHLYSHMSQRETNRTVIQSVAGATVVVKLYLLWELLHMQVRMNNSHCIPIGL